MIKACAIVVSVFALFSLASFGCGATKPGGVSDPFGNHGGNSGANSGFGATGGQYFPPHAGNNGQGASSGQGASGIDNTDCGVKMYGLQKLPPQVIVVQDRSGSMMRDIAGNDPATSHQPTRWSQTTAALNQVLMQTEQNVLWGMQMFSTCHGTGNGHDCTPGPCAVSGLYQAPAVAQAAALGSLLSMNAPVIDTGATPTTAAINLAVMEAKALTLPNPKFLLLVTDGEPNCLNPNGKLDNAGDDDPNGAIMAVHNAFAAGFPVFVVGIATGGSTANTTLNTMATEGGRPQAGATKYYPVSNQAQLATALESIAGQVQSCTFPFDMAPPDLMQVVVDIDGMRLTETTDWEFGAGNKSVVVKGSWCDKLKSGQAMNAVIKFGCPGMVIP